MEEKIISVNNLLTFENSVFKSYIFWSSILVLKMLFMSLLTAFQRFKNGVAINPEDLFLLRHILAIINPTVLPKTEDSDSKNKFQLAYNDPDVERARRAHRNDMENILPFFVVGFFYVMINPEKNVAINLYRAVGISRIVHTLVYSIIVVPQPARVLTFGLTFFITIYMAFKVLHY